MKQITIRELTKLTAKTLKAEPFEVVERKTPIGRYLPYAAKSRRAPFKHDFTGELTRVFGKLKKGGKMTFPELSEFGGKL